VEDWSPGGKNHNSVSNYMFSTKQEAHTLLQKIREHFPLIIGSLEGIEYKAKFSYMIKGILFMRKYAMSSINYLKKKSLHTVKLPFSFGQFILLQAVINKAYYVDYIFMFAKNGKWTVARERKSIS
jgi:hypothetical protein